MAAENVLIVESPAKAKTINKYLGSTYTVLASFGHIRDLPSKDGSVDPENDFAMQWQVDAKAKKRLDDIATACKGAKNLMLATDPDREGEAISWHLQEELQKRKVLKDLNVRYFKLFKTQFPYPDIRRLMTPYGESSPMALAWTFLGFSKGYNIFMGVVEILGGLLLFRRTLTLGAIIALGATINVMMINYFYDVPVKILSTHLVLMTVLLLIPNAKQLLQFFLTNKSVKLSIGYKPMFKKKSIRFGLMAFKYLLIGYVLISGIDAGFKNQKMRGINVPKPYLHGTYRVSDFVMNGDTIPPISTTSWKYINIGHTNFFGGFFTATKMNKVRYTYRSSIDSLVNKIKLTNSRDSTKVYYMNYMKKDSIYLFKTIIEKDTIMAKATKVLEKDFLLMNRGFRWISEYPYNR